MMSEDDDNKIMQAAHRKLELALGVYYPRDPILREGYLAALDLVRQARAELENAYRRRQGVDDV